ncbi:MAG: NAD/NADP octopine/nopaline dehydrogenase, partial [Alphaproteobacteria bacterium]|nr:NAD/NADP octopine/nopaline dehydrogenase [Alphaproteobacteria bacterium]
LSALHLSRKLAERAIAAPIVAWGTTAVTGRRGGPVSVSVMTRRARLDMATIPAAASRDGLAVSTRLFGDRFEPRPDALAIALSNVNPISHMALALCNITRIERGEAWPQYHYMTDTVSRLIEALDAERLALAAAFGLQVRSIARHLELSFDVPEGPVAGIARLLHARRGGPPGPTSLDTRFVLEDVPYGIAFTVALAQAAGVPVPLHAAGLALCSALYGRDFAAENELIATLGVNSRPAAALHALARDGWPR